DHRWRHRGRGQRPERFVDPVVAARAGADTVDVDQFDLVVDQHVDVDIDVQYDVDLYVHSVVDDHDQHDCATDHDDACLDHDITDDGTHHHDTLVDASDHPPHVDDFDVCRLHRGRRRAG